MANSEAEWVGGEGYTPVIVHGTSSAGQVQVHAETIDAGRKWLMTVRSPVALLMRIEFEAGPVEEAELARPGSVGYSEEHWQRVLGLWREAQEVAPRTPVMYLARQVGRSEATVARWLRRMKQMGLLTG